MHIPYARRQPPPRTGPGHARGEMPAPVPTRPSPPGIGRHLDVINPLHSTCGCPAATSAVTRPRLSSSTTASRRVRGTVRSHETLRLTTAPVAPGRSRHVPIPASRSFLGVPSAQTPAGIGRFTDFLQCCGESWKRHARHPACPPHASRSAVPVRNYASGYRLERGAADGPGVFAVCQWSRAFPCSPGGYAQPPAARGRRRSGPGCAQSQSGGCPRPGEQSIRD